ncbi:MAG: nucleotidyltransferase domain-containing protein [Firmicutes bacterium HGW-Firmicutes-12]|jgi:predicted nucleotidyltransferase|nr:MAG: nucleotidyltransferase domain-containing protein [Firmicutes bacterium HGW-Firmicutes-12]
MDKSQIIEIVKSYAVIVDKHIKPSKVILYGSYAKGDWREDSDIDVAVVMETVKGDFLEKEALLFRLRRNIDDRIEPVLLEEGNDCSGFLAEILKYGQVIFSQ